LSDAIDPKHMLAGGLIFGGVLWTLFLTSIPTTENLKASVIVGNTVHTCPPGNILSNLQCFPMQRGNIDISVNNNDVFQLPSDERGALAVLTGSILVNDGEYRRYGPGQQVTLPYKATVTAERDGTKLRFERNW
jgi:hypothetical protein